MTWLHRLAAVALALGALLALASAASASVAQEEQAGARVLGELEAGRVHCSALKGSDFDHVGEYAMGRMMGSPRAHEAMNRMMTTMMGSGSEQQMHEAMGRRFAGCPGGRLPASFGRMMGAVNAMGMMGGPGARGWNGPGGMMGGFWSGGEGNDSSDGPSAAAMLGMMAVLIVAVALALLLLRPKRRPADSLGLLQQRLARGELTVDEYRDLKRLLEGA